MIVFDKLSFSYPGTVTPALSEISLRIDVGEAVLVRGASVPGNRPCCTA